MEKVSNKWFKEHGFKYLKIVIKEQNYVKTRHIQELYKNKTHVRFDRVYEVTNTHISNYYMLFAYGNGFKIEKNVFYRKPTIEEMECVLKLIKAYD